MEGTRFRIGEFAFDALSGELARGGEVQRLRPQAATALRALAEEGDRLVSRDDLIGRIWPDGGSEPEVGLNVCIAQVRAAFGDDPDDPAYVETLRGRGYRLIAPVELIASPPRRRPPLPVALSIIGIAFAGVVLGPLLLSRSTPVRLAVMPFDSVTDHAVDSLAFLRRGLAEDIINRLASTDPARLSILARTSSFSLADSGMDATALGRRLDAQYVLEGTLRVTSPGVYRVTAQLLDTESGAYVWADQFDRARAGVVTLDDTLAAGVLTTLGGHLDWALRDASVTPDLPAPEREAVLRARYLTRQGTREAGSRAIAELTGVLGQGNSHPAVWIELANARLLMGEVDRAEAALRRVAETDVFAPGYHLAAARVAFYGRQDVESANELLAQAVAIDPGSSEVRHVYAQTLAAVGDLDRAMVHGRMALDLDPVSASVRGDIGWVLYYGRAFGEARSRCASTLELRPESRGALTCTILAAHFAGTLSEESVRLGEAIALLGGDEGVSERLMDQVSAGDSGGLWAWMLKAGSDAGVLDFATRARLAALAGDGDQALALLEAAADSGRRHLWAGVDPAFDALGADLAASGSAGLP